MNLENMIIFVDTNIVVPSSSWNIYTAHLNKMREGNTKFLTNNSELDVLSLEKAIKDANFAIDLLKKEKVFLTQGVLKQSIRKIDEITENIERRTQNHFYLQLNQTFPISLREKEDAVFENLSEYYHMLNNLKSTVDNKHYQPPNNQKYFFIANFIREISEKFETSKSNHHFDNGTDNYIVSSLIYEIIVNAKKGIIYSNDSDVQNLLGTTYFIFDRLKPLLQNHEEFKFFYLNAPELKRVDYSTNITESKIDFLRKGEEIVSRVGGFKDIRISGEERLEYEKKITLIANFLTRISPEIVETITQKEV